MGELIYTVSCCEREGLAYAVIGRGSNLLFDDGEIETVLIRTTALDTVLAVGNGRICADCGASLGTLTRVAAREGLSGIGFACGIPGTVGGALFMNAGAHGRAILDVVESVLIWDADSHKTETVFNRQLNSSYRKSVFQEKNAVILQATLCLKPHGDPNVILAEMRALLRQRNATQPTDLPSAGSVFRRPSPEVPLSKIMDELGLKGRRVGGALVSPKHAGFIVNDGGATARDVRTLIEEIQNIVESERGFRPTPELRFIPEKR